MNKYFLKKGVDFLPPLWYYNDVGRNTDRQTSPPAFGGMVRMSFSLLASAPNPTEKNLKKI